MMIAKMKMNILLTKVGVSANPNPTMTKKIIKKAAENAVCLNADLVN